MLNKVSIWWYELSVRKQRILAMGMVLVSVFMLYQLLFSSLLDRYQHSKLANEQLTERYHQLQYLDGDALAINRICANTNALVDGFDLAAIRVQLEDMGADQLQIDQTADDVFISLEITDGPALLRWVEQLTCVNIAIKSIDMLKVGAIAQPQDLPSTLPLRVNLNLVLVERFG